MSGDTALGAAIAFAIAQVTTPAGVSGAVLLLPVQISILNVPSPGVTPTNLLYNVIATPGGLWRYWRTGAQEMWRDFSKRAFCASVQRYIPEVTMADMVPGPSGVRAQALDAQGRLIDDFVVEADGGRIMHVRNAPSPAATSSLAIARLVADAAEEAFGEPSRGVAVQRQA